MQFQVLISVAVVLAILVIAYVVRRRHQQNMQKPDTFVLAAALGYLMIAGGLLIGALPLSVALVGRSIPMDKHFLFGCSFALYLSAFAASYFCYRVVVTDKAIVAGAFRPRTVLFSDVVDWGVIRGGGTRDLVMYLQSGQQLRVAGYLIKEFDQLVGLVTSRMAFLPAAQPGRSEKFQKSAKRAQSMRTLAWILIVGFGLIALGLIGLIIIKKLP